MFFLHRYFQNQNNVRDIENVKKKEIHHMTNTCSKICNVCKWNSKLLLFGINYCNAQDVTYHN